MAIPRTSNRILISMGFSHNLIKPSDRANYLVNIRESEPHSTTLCSLSNVAKLALEILSSDENDSDYTAYQNLLLALLTLDDDKNAIAASVLAFLRNRISYPRSPRDSVPDNDTFQYYLAFADCDGQCGRHLGSGDVMWRCKDCIRIAFDKSCFQKTHGWEVGVARLQWGNGFLCIPVWGLKRLDAFPGGGLCTRWTGGYFVW